MLPALDSLGAPRARMPVLHYVLDTKSEDPNFSIKIMKCMKTDCLGADPVNSGSRRVPGTPHEPRVKGGGVC